MKIFHVLILQFAISIGSTYVYFSSQDIPAETSSFVLANVEALSSGELPGWDKDEGESEYDEDYNDEFIRHCVEKYVECYEHAGYLNSCTSERSTKCSFIKKKVRSSYL